MQKQKRQHLLSAALSSRILYLLLSLCLCCQNFYESVTFSGTLEKNMDMDTNVDSDMDWTWIWA